MALRGPDVERKEKKEGKRCDVDWLCLPPPPPLFWHQCIPTECQKQRQALSRPPKKKEEKVIQILSSISLHSPHVFCEKAIHLPHMYTYALPTSTDPSLLQMARYSVLGGRGKGRVGLGSGKRGSLLSQGSISGMAYPGGREKEDFLRRGEEERRRAHARD